MHSVAVLRKVVAAYEAQRDQISDSDLDDEQPITLKIDLTLGDVRKMRRRRESMNAAIQSFKA